MLYLDTNILIYLFELHDPYSKKVAIILEEFTDGGKQLITSAVTVTEFLTGTTLSSLETLHKVPKLNIISVNENIAEQAAILQRKNSIKIGDSIHLATAIQQKAEAFFTNDKKLIKVVEKYISVISL
jgi:predicted nucleic acid-binding protein